MKINDNEVEKDAKKRIGISDYTLLSSPGTVGHYEEGELLHIFLIENKTKFHHYFAVLSFEEFAEPDPSKRSIPVTSTLVSINAQFSMGVFKTRLSLPESSRIFSQLCEGRLEVDGKEFMLPSELQLLPKTHIPSLWGNDIVPINKILKPNFLGDKYIIEFEAFTNPIEGLLGSDLVSKVNDEVKSVIPIDLAAVYDRIGSFIFQFPITLVSGYSGISKDWVRVTVTLDFDAQAIDSSNLMSLVTARLDDVITGHQSYQGGILPESLTIGDSNNLELKIFNTKNGVIYHSSMGNFIRTFNFSMGIGGQNSEPRIYEDSGGTTQEVQLFSYSLGGVVSKSTNYDTRTKRRILQNEIMSKSGRFVSIRKGEREKAMTFLKRQLLEKASSCSEIWLWDPFLDYNDIFDTLYCVGNTDIVMKCVTAYKKFKSRVDDSGGLSTRKLARLLLNSLFSGKTANDGFTEFKRVQKASFLRKSNNLGVNLTLRACHANFGFDFHDRFLFLIPKEIDEIPTVFSLGTSINGFGKSHHLIQQTLDPRNIIEAFDELWNMLNNDESTVIKLPEDKNEPKR